MSTTTKTQSFTFVVELRRVQKFELITLMAATMSEALALYRQSALAKQASKIVRVL